jgi:hypothetical protein
MRLFATTLLTFIASAALAAPTFAQYIFTDTNGDAQCTSADALSSSVTSIDVYLDTNHDANGTVKTCATNASQPLDMSGYDIVMHVQGSGSVTFNSWTNAAAGFSQLNALTQAGADVGVGYTSPIGGNLSPGRYKLGTFSVTVTGSPDLTFTGVSTNVAIPSFGTGFGTSCDASTYANTEVLGVDFQDHCTALSGTAVEATTWGKIKQLYR